MKKVFLPWCWTRLSLIWGSMIEGFHLVSFHLMLPCFESFGGLARIIPFPSPGRKPPLWTWWAGETGPVTSPVGASGWRSGKSTLFLSLRFGARLAWPGSRGLWSLQRVRYGLIAAKLWPFSFLKLNLKDDISSPRKESAEFAVIQKVSRI